MTCTKAPEALQLSRIRPGLRISCPEKFACSSTPSPCPPPHPVLRGPQAGAPLPKPRSFRLITGLLCFGKLTPPRSSQHLGLYESFSDNSALRIFLFSEFLKHSTSWLNVQVCAMSSCRKMSELCCQVYVDVIPSRVTSDMFLLSPESCFLY